MSPAELYSKDCLGIQRFTQKQAKAIVEKVKREGLLVSDPPQCDGRGIIIAGGGKYLSWAWVLCRWMRIHLKTHLPIQVWYMGDKEMPGKSRALFSAMDVETVDVHKLMAKHPVREMNGWALKTYAVRHCPCRHVMFIDADCFPWVQPEEILNDVDVRKHGSLFFHDVGNHHKWEFYADCGLLQLEKEWETGQFVWDKVTGWMALRWAMWMSEHCDVFYKTAHGDKGVIEAAFRIADNPHIMGDASTWEGYGISHVYAGRESFRHCMAMKRGEWPMLPEFAPMFEEWKTLRY